ncbi:MAG TPA: tetratricopeptide repeat protein [Leptolyngbyaceae cyanobacterium]
MNVSQKRGRWLINAVLIMAVFAFVGFSFIPVLSEVFNQNPSSANRPGASPEAAATNLEEQLQARAKSYEIVLQREPENATVLNEYVTIQLTLGQVYAQQQKFPEAIAVYDRASEVNKKDFRPVLAKGIVLQLQGKTDEAKALYASATELAPPELKEEIKAQVQQFETKAAAPTSSSTESPANKTEAKPATTTPESSDTSQPAVIPPEAPANQN